MNLISDKLSLLADLNNKDEIVEIFELKNMTVKKLNNNTSSSKSVKDYKELSAGRTYNLRIHKGKFDNEKENEDSLELLSSSKSMKLLSRRSRNSISSKVGLNESSKEGSLEKNSISSIAVDLFQAKKSKNTPDINKELRSTIEQVNKVLKKSNSTDSLKLLENKNIGYKQKKIDSLNNLTNSEKKNNPIRLSEYLNLNVQGSALSNTSSSTLITDSSVSK